MTGYDSVYNSSLDLDVKRKDYQYALFPVWAFVYTGADQKKHYYSIDLWKGMQGGRYFCLLTGKKLLRDAVLAGLGVAAVLLMIGGLLI